MDFYFEKLFFWTDTAGFGKYRMSGYGRIGVYREGMKTVCAPRMAKAQVFHDKTTSKLAVVSYNIII